MTDGFIIENICNQVIAEGLAESEADFCIRWLSRNEGYMHNLRLQNTQPSADALAVCANKLAFYAAAFCDSDRSYSQATGRNLRELQLICEEALQRVCQPKPQGHSIL